MATQATPAQRYADYLEACAVRRRLNPGSLRQPLSFSQFCRAEGIA